MPAGPTMTTVNIEMYYYHPITYFYFMYFCSCFFYYSHKFVS